MGYALVQSALGSHACTMRPVPAEATYLAWIDCRETGLDDKALLDRFMDVAHACPESGPLFGPEGTGYVRLNIACPQARLNTALGHIAQAFS